MTKAELIACLAEYPDDMEVMINDHGALDLNFGPTLYYITQQDEDDTGDCDGRVGEQVILIGGGCY